MNTGDRSKEQEIRTVEANAEAARTRVGEDLQALGDKLTPEHIKEEIKTDAKEAVIQAKDAALEKVSDVKEVVSGAGRSTLYFAERNAIPLALIGAGLGWLLATRSRREGRLHRRGSNVYSGETRETGYSAPLETSESYSMPLETSESYSMPLETSESSSAPLETSESSGALLETRERGFGRAPVMRAQRLMHEGAEKGRQMGHQAQERVSRLTRRSRDYAKQSPLAMGALSLAAGLGVGLALPTTRKEEELFGPAREKLTGQARGTAEQLKETVKDTAREIKDKLSESMTH
jgi:uncharacterized protein YjbJ (UPF0337 family)